MTTQTVAAIELSPGDVILDPSGATRSVTRVEPFEGRRWSMVQVSFAQNATVRVRASKVYRVCA